MKIEFEYIGTEFKGQEFSQAFANYATLQVEGEAGRFTLRVTPPNADYDKEKIIYDAATLEQAEASCIRFYVRMLEKEIEELKEANII